MSADFDTCWGLLSVNEGGFVVDDGGPTNWGVTEAVARRWGYTGDMSTMPQSTGRQIAMEEYWTPYNLQLLPTWAAFQVLDFVFNGGPAIRDLQMVVGVTVDGMLGIATAAAVTAMNPWEFTAKYNSKRLQYLASLKQPAYADGRMNRIANNLLQGALPA